MGVGGNFLNQIVCQEKGKGTPPEYFQSKHKAYIILWKKSDQSLIK